VQKWHRTHNRHHLEYAGKKSYDFEAMVIDWECSRFTKISSPLTARGEYERMCMSYPDMNPCIKHDIKSALIKLGL
jgi:hypothetical protein